MQETATAYDEAGRPLQVIDGIRRITELAYNAAGLVIRETRALGTVDEATTLFAYDLLGRLVSLIDPEGNETQFRYNGWVAFPLRTIH